MLMKRLPSNLRSTLENLAVEAGTNRNIFNKLVGSNYRKIGQGAFRIVMDAGDYVIKLRRHKPCADNEFPMRQIDTSNHDEVRGYKEIAKQWEFVTQFVLKPTLIRLPNKHNAVIMPKVDAVVRTLEEDGSDNDEWQDDAPVNLVDQVTFIQETFRDGHTANIGILGKRAYLIDINFAGLFYGAASEPKDTEAWAKRLLDAVEAGVGDEPKKKKLYADCVTAQDRKLLEELAA
jgi:hypothetical protein